LTGSAAAPWRGDAERPLTLVARALDAEGSVGAAMSQKRLVLLRHAKSSWKDPDLDDHDRPLAPRGRRAAAEVARHLRVVEFTPEVVLCSSAARARETLELIELGTAGRVFVEDGLYGAPASRLLARLRTIGPMIDSVLFIGHNPGIEELGASLVGSKDWPDRFPTAALADLRFAVETWDELRPGVGRLHGCVTPSRAL
jgi:phosphohistidine phosphatase